MNRISRLFDLARSIVPHGPAPMFSGGHNISQSPPAPPRPGIPQHPVPLEQASSANDRPLTRGELADLDPGATGAVSDEELEVPQDGRVVLRDGKHVFYREQPAPNGYGWRRVAAGTMIDGITLQVDQYIMVRGNNMPPRPMPPSARPARYASGGLVAAPPPAHWKEAREAARTKPPEQHNNEAPLDQRGEVPGEGYPDWPEEATTFKERQMYQRGIADAREMARRAARVTVEIKTDSNKAWNDSERRIAQTFSQEEKDALQGAREFLQEGMTVTFEDDSPVPTVRDRFPKYYVEVPQGTKYIDIYLLLRLFKITNHELGHAVKKVLLSGLRTGGKSRRADIKEAIAALQRHLELEGE